MNIPGFVAEKAINRSRGRYRTAISSVVSAGTNGAQGIFPAIRSGR